MLETKKLTKHFGGLVAVKDLDMEVNQNEIVGLIGPNGAGKSTVFNLITGVFRATSGSVFYQNEDITRKKPHDAAQKGIGRTFQGGFLFKEFTVLENVTASFFLYPRSGFWESILRTRGYRNKERYIMEQSLEILKLLGLDSHQDELARNLPHGSQKLLGLARALAVKPKLLLLDEPLAGMTGAEITNTLNTLEKIRCQGITILMVEHNMEIMKLCDRVVVLNFGHKIAEGLPADIQKNEEVMQAYFGVEDEPEH